ncbi:ribonuclease H-like domain-containing protein [Tanacetum coccineum]|uniref:Ribonuclease H-like domain-containing protein n=1 Tax=Tanacetum coccineum TaxID=301880 RepID=A0ABQ5I3I8_9ASTR
MTLPYGMLLTRLFKHVRVAHPHAFSDDHYLVDYVMIPLSEKRVFMIMPNGKRPRLPTSTPSESSESTSTSSRMIKNQTMKMPTDTVVLTPKQHNKRITQTIAILKYQNPHFEEGRKWKLKKRISTGKGWYFPNNFTITAEEIQDVERKLEAQVSEVSLRMQLKVTQIFNHPQHGVLSKQIQGAIKNISSAQNDAFVYHKAKVALIMLSLALLVPYSTSAHLLLFKPYSLKRMFLADLEQIDDLDIEEMDINWQIAMIAIRMKKFYEKTGRRVRVDGKTPIGFDKKKLECFNCHNTEAGKQEKSQMGFLTMDDGIVNWGEHTEVEETNHALMAISSSSSTSLSGDYTPTPQEEIDESLYVYGKKGPQEPEPNVSDDRSSEYSTCQSNDSKHDHRELPLNISVDPESQFQDHPLKNMHKVLFTETECLVVSSDFKMPDENQILLKVPRHHNMYSFDMKTPTPTKGFACLIAKATSDESKLWHRRLGNENQLSHRVKIIRSDNGTEFKNRDMLEFCGNKGIKQEYSNARTPQQNGVTERMNKTLIEAARTMLADSLLPTTFWAEAVSTACYIFNRKISNPHAGASEVTNSVGTSQTPSFNAFEEKDEEVELIVVPSTVRNTEEIAESRKSSINSKKEEILTELQQEKKCSSIGHFRR